MAASTARNCCCVPKCSSSSTKQPYLSFHSFPTEEETKKRWIHAIRRDEGKTFTVLKGSTYVCGQHFTESDYSSTAERKRLKRGVIPSRFEWNSWGSIQKKRPNVLDRLNRQHCSNVLSATGDEKPAVYYGPVLPTEHDYTRPPSPGILDAAAARIRELEAQVQALTVSRIQINKFCHSDADFRFYTRFPSEKVFRIFWASIEPSALNLAYWSKAQRQGLETVPGPSPNRKLQLIDEFFLYCCRVAAGLREKVLADVFDVSITTVSRVIITWANFLYLVLGSLPIWMTKGQVRATMPEKFQKYCPDVRVILDCTEIRCENPTALTLQSEMFSHYKNYPTFKGLVGVAPCGAITFVSQLFTGSISDREITKQSGLLDLLEPGDWCMADKGFTIEKILEDVGARLVIPPFKRAAQLTKEETKRTQAIARLRIVVERVIRRIKENHIWDTTIPLTLTGTVNQIWANCCLMANYQGPLDVHDAAVE